MMTTCLRLPARIRLPACVLACLLSLSSLAQSGESPWQRLARRPSTLGIESGALDLHTTAFRLRLVRASQTVASLSPATLPGFDYTPGDSLKVRSSDGMYHLGDITLRIRNGAGDWIKYSSAAKRRPVQALPATGHVLAAADLGPTFPADMPLQVRRYWEVDGDELTLRFELKNTSAAQVEIGSLGIPMIFNNLLDGKTLGQAHAQNVFYDPYTGEDAGYLQVARLSGASPTLLVVPYGHAPFEAYNPLLDDPTPRGITFEGFYEWLVCSKAYAEKEWAAAQSWNLPTSIILAPGETRSYGWQFLLCGSVRDIETTLAAHHRPVAIGIPGYVLPQDVEGKLFLQYPKKVLSMEVSPAGALEIVPAATPQNHGWKSYAVHGNTWGRARLIITYEDSTVQTIQYKVIHPEDSVISAYGHFLTTAQWFDKKTDLFHRSPGIITYDEEKHAQVTQDNRAWIAGLSDEGGAGSWLGATMKQFVLPDKTEVAKLEDFVNQTLWGHIQYDSGPLKYGVRKSLFYYEPDSLPKGTYDSSINFHTWSAWPLKEAESTGRSYNYPHVAAAWWVLYRLARNHRGLVTSHAWDYYLQHAYETILAMMSQAPYYTQFGQMEGTVFYLILKDLRAESMTAMAGRVEALMKKRALRWHTLKYPFGSEMPWDSTGQEEVYIWSVFFGYDDKAAITLKAILAYMPTLPSWAYNGNARRYWDFLYGGKLQRIERMIHHYGSELNAIPVLAEYRRNPADLYLLRVGYGGVLGGIANIGEDGFAPCAFHSFPATLKNDGITGDYGSGFFGYAVNTATYITRHKDLGWLCFGGNLAEKDGWVTARITTAARSAVYIAPAGLWLRLDAGRLVSASYQEVTGAVKLVLEPADAYTPDAYLQVDQPARLPGIGRYVLKGAPAKDHGRYRLPLTASPTEFFLSPEKPQPARPAQRHATVLIDPQEKGNPVSPTLHGVFFEEISHAGEGGLYAELIQNRGFEESNIPPGMTLAGDFILPPRTPHFSMPAGKVSDWKMEWRLKSDYPAWSSRATRHAAVSIARTADDPLSFATPHSLHVAIAAADNGDTAEVINEGFWGISVIAGDSYNLRFFLRHQGYPGTITAFLRSSDGRILASHSFQPSTDTGWSAYTATLQASATDPKAEFVLAFDKPGDVWLDMVSLFPEKTFRHRPNGLRADLAQYIADLHPAFVRWPGGCFVEGIDIQSAPDWKTTIGPIEARTPTYSPWEYYTSNGFGYHEYLQFCEDIGAAALYVFNAGVSCDFRSGTFVTPDSLHPYIQNALDAIEYAIGAVDSKWGSVRAAAGHPNPFPLKYVEVGNEQHGPRYAERYNIFYDSIKARYPQIKIIASMGIGDVNEYTLRGMKRVDIADEHAYKAAGWAMTHFNHFDGYPRDKWHLYVGEYATNAGVGNGDMEAALSDAVYIMSMENNGDLVKMCSYAPLLVNVNDVDWPVNLIHFDAARSFARISYYAIQLLSNNRSDTNFQTTVQVSPPAHKEPSFPGGIGLATWDTHTAYKDIEVWQNGRQVYKSDLLHRPGDWRPFRGSWRVQDNALAQLGEGPQRLALLKGRKFSTYTLKLKAKKLDGYNAFIIPFAVKDSNTFYRVHIGAWVNRVAVFEKVTGGDEVSNISSPISLKDTIQPGRWYEIRVDVGADTVKCWLDGRLLMSFTEPEKFFAIAGEDAATGEIIVKMVNAYADPLAVKLPGVNPGPAALTTLSAPTLTAENTFDQPRAYTPEITNLPAGTSSVILKPYSINILRIPAANLGTASSKK
ncbi:DUF5695 domain-containing protein [Puia dinghuensis]|uniref:non-reducing end alpha-L-arabinofuranosidase n=1 Tax=Puia dinghuensis TaxID=1792502 RepID=A0A8J2UI61_9BACT|nr:DUF5695 domain-containing protein [Puia dinghuensis]GGB20578.1 hypothetical protein GCM10011511_50400 [Puia dinghuensis]